MGKRHLLENLQQFGYFKTVSVYPVTDYLEFKQCSLICCSHKNIPDNELTVAESLPTQLAIVKVGDMCVFRDIRCDNWKIGKLGMIIGRSGKFYNFIIQRAKQPKHSSVH